MPKRIRHPSGKPCSENGCGRSSVARGWCRKHYARWHTTGSIHLNGREPEAHGLAGKSKIPEYGVWRTMKSRCFNPNDKNWANYGGRGITVCSEWKDSFTAFITFLGRRLSPRHTLERIDNEKGYEPGNCIWATRKEQNRNHRRSRILSLNGQSKTVSQWAEDLGIGRPVLESRLRSGWTDQAILTTPVRRKHQ